MKTGINFDFDTNDIIISPNGTFRKSDLGGQICGLISLSEVCRLTKPEVGARLAGRLQNVPSYKIPELLTEATRMVERDGGRDVTITLTEENKLHFVATYD